MRTFTKEYKVYGYSELSDEAKEEVKRWYLDDDSRPTEFQRYCEEDLRHIFPNSKLNVQFCLSSCQGDGFNIYGELYMLDVFKVVRDKSYCGDNYKKFWDYMTEDEEKMIKAYIDVYEANSILLPRNVQYTYCLANHIGFAEAWLDDFDSDGYEQHADTFRKFETLVQNLFSFLCSNYEKEGYNYFYEVDDEELKETCDANGWEFFEDGTFCSID